MIDAIGMDGKRVAGFDAARDRGPFGVPHGEAGLRELGRDELEAAEGGGAVVVAAAAAGVAAGVALVATSAALGFVAGAATVGAAVALSK